MIRTYSELMQIPDFEGRVEYLSLHGKVGYDTFGFDRVFNQDFYQHSAEWKAVRRQVIVRDCGYDLGCIDRLINGEPIIIHHMNPITLDDIRDGTEFLLDPEYLICTRDLTHKIIHYGSVSQLREVEWTERTPNDTCPWRK